MKLLSLCSLLFVFSCAHGPTQPGDPRAIAESPKIFERYQQAEKSYFLKRYTKAWIETEVFLQDHSKSALTYKIRNLRGLILGQQNRFDDSWKEFETSYQLAPSSRDKGSIRLNQMKLLSKQGKYADEVKFVSKVEKEELSEKELIEFLQLQAVALEQTGDLNNAVVVVAKLANREATPGKHTQDLSRLLEKMSPDVLKSYFFSGEEKVLKIAAANALLAKSISEKDSAGMMRWQSELKKLGVESPNVSTETIENQVSINQEDLLPRTTEDAIPLPAQAVFPKRNVIGAVLPLSGKLENVGKRMAAALQLAEEMVGGIQVVIKDMGADESSAVKAVDELVAEEGVLAIIGPLSRKESLVVARRCQRWKVPNLNLSVREKLSTVGEYVFQFAPTPEPQVKALLEYAKMEMGVEHLGLVHAEDSLGQDWGRAFWREIVRSNYSVTGYSTYSPKEADYIRVIDELMGIDQVEARSLEYSAAKKIQNELLETGAKKKSVRRKDRILLTPQPDFDALIVPDYPQVVGQIASSLSYRDAQIKLLGVGLWNSEETAQRSGKAVEGAVFTDYFFSDLPNLQFQEFSDKFSQVTGEKPTTLDAIAFEAFQVLETTIRRNGMSSRQEIQNSLRQELVSVDALTGTLKIRNGVTEFPVFFAKIDHGTISLLTK